MKWLIGCRTWVAGDHPAKLSLKGDQYLADLLRTELGSLYRFAGLQRWGSAWWQVVMPPMVWSIHGR